MIKRAKLDGEYLHQWDKGRALIVHGFDEGTLVDFVFNRDSESVPSKVLSGMVSIPNQVLTNSGVLVAYFYVDLGDAGYTAFKHSMYVTPRTKPADYVYEETEVLTWTSLDKRIRALEENGLPALGAGFEGKLLFGGKDGVMKPLALGDGLYLEDDALHVAGGATVPTKISAFENDAGYTTEAHVQELLAAFPSFEITVVQELPAVGEEKTIYLVPFADDSGSYLEYLYVNGAWEVVGSGKHSGENAAYPDWSHLKWYVLGDSLTDPAGGVHTSKFYYEYIAEKTGIQVIVDGMGGTGYYAGASTNRRFADRVPNIPADVDIVTIFGSGNDIQHGYDNYKSAMSAALKIFYLERPGLSVVVVPPTPWKGYSKRGEEWKGYCDTLALMALNYNARYVSDMFDCPPFDPNSAVDLNAFFTKDTTDGIHPDENGHEAIARYIYNAMLQELEFEHGYPRGGADGDGQNPSQDGFSPTATVTQTANGATITITDKNGTTTATVTNGRDGRDGLTPTKGVDYFTEEDKQSLVEVVLEELPKWDGGAY